MTNDTVRLFPACRSTSLKGLGQVKELIGEWNRQCGPDSPELELEVAAGLDETVARACVQARDSMILACGFATTEIMAAVQKAACAELPSIISQPDQLEERLHTPSASLFDTRSVTRVRSMREGVRKALLRDAAGRLGELREVRRSEELDQYFMLRYAVWQDAGYLPATSPLQGGGWELDCFDRFARPIGLFLPSGQLVACARLVQEYGNERPEHVNAINRLVERRAQPALTDAFSYRNKPEHPFDILWEFRGFRDYFASLVRARCAVAEVSRVIVDPEFRGRGLLEVMVDSLVSLAREEGVKVLMLACPDAIAHLYQRCGFVPVPELVSDRFFDIERRSVVMELRLGGNR